MLILYHSRSTFSEAGFNADDYGAELEELKRAPKVFIFCIKSCLLLFFAVSSASESELVQYDKKEGERRRKEKDFFH